MWQKKPLSHKTGILADICKSQHLQQYFETVHGKQRLILLIIILQTERIAVPFSNTFFELSFSFFINTPAK